MGYELLLMYCLLSLDICNWHEAMSQQCARLCQCPTHYQSQWALLFLYWETTLKLSAQDTFLFSNSIFQGKLSANRYLSVLFFKLTSIIKRKNRGSTQFSYHDGKFYYKLVTKRGIDTCFSLTKMLTNSPILPDRRNFLIALANFWKHEGQHDETRKRSQIRQICNSVS